MKAVHLKTEYLKNPMGIDVENPRFFWNCEDGVRQTAYQIHAFGENGEALWDSGKVQSGSMTDIMYPLNLVSRQTVLWQVRLWDEKDMPGEWSDTARFEMGLLRASEWTAKWISGNYTVNKRQRYPADCFRKAFSCGKTVKKARLYATACGVYEVRINGTKAGDFILAPGITDYRKRIQYQTVDVTELIHGGQNEITAELADGWYRGSVGAWGLKNEYGTETKLLCQLELVYADGSVQTVATDDSWQWSNDGPIRFADNKDGEIVDANRVPSYSGRAKAVSFDTIPQASNNVPVREQERFSPVRITTPSGKTVLDFSQNIAGYVVFRVQAKKGQLVFLRFGEMLDADGEFTQKNIQCSNQKITTPLQQVEYRCKEGENEYKTKFAVFGFRYVLVETDVPFSEKDFTAVAVYSDIQRTGFFDSSNELLNRFAEATVWSAKGNSLDLPTDCPTRERHGWTGDAQIFFETAAYFFDYAAFSKKYLRDVYDWQKKDGRLPQIAPYGGVDFYMWVMNGSVGWSDVGILLPYRFYRMYGDSRILSEYYDRMKQYAGFMIRRCGKKGGIYAIYTKPSHLHGKDRKYLVNYGQSYGEWAEPADVHPNHWTDVVSPHPEVSTAYTSYVLGIMSEIAGILGKQEDADYYRSYAENCKKSYQALMCTKEYSLDTDRQAQLVRPLAFDLLTREQREYAQKRLVLALEHYGWRLGTGFLSTPLILDVLSDIDIAYAYRLLENEQMPGWLFMPKNGATTVWESWEGTAAQNGIASLNHYSKGAVCEWLFRTMCGIRIAGENQFSLSPKPGGRFSYAQAEWQSIYGKVAVRWEITTEQTVYTFRVPPNTTADITLPDGQKKTVGPGECRWAVPLKR